MLLYQKSIYLSIYMYLSAHHAAKTPSPSVVQCVCVSVRGGASISCKARAVGSVKTAPRNDVAPF
eukprot:scaffold49777_cov85-Phaeocystis_antarctica.AAC.4